MNTEARRPAARIVLFGGTFDPIHNAHLAIARAARDAFAFERVLFVPAAVPPHKTGDVSASWEDRIRMCELACAGGSGFEVSRIEGGSEVSYSILTVERLLAAGAGPLAFLIGADAFAELSTWRRWQDLTSLVEFVVVSRPGSQYALPEGARVFPLTGVDLPVSSSEIRDEIARGEATDHVPAAVLDYIRDHALYRPAAGV